MSNRLLSFWVALCAYLFTSVAWAAVPPKPAQNPIYDGPDVLTPAQEKQLGDRLVAFKKARGIEVALVIVSTLGEDNIRDLGIAIGDTWGLGDKERRDGIVLLFVADKARAAAPGATTCGCVTIEVGEYLEGDLTDSASGAILDRHVMAPLTSGDFFKAANGGLKGIEAVLSDGEAAKDYKQTADSGGDKKEEGGGYPWWLWLIGIAILIGLQWMGVPVIELLFMFGGRSGGGGSGGGGGNSVGGGGSFGGGGASR